MPEQFNRKTFPFLEGGINLNVAPDETPDGQYPYLLNVYSQQAGTLQPRPGYTALSSPGSPVVGIKRVNNSIPGAVTPFERFVMLSSGFLTGGQNGGQIREAGYSGLPPSMVPAAPAQSPETWLYIADALRMRKIRVDEATAQNIGIFPPTQEPTASLGQPQYKSIQDYTSASGINNFGAAAAPTTASRVPASTTIAAILYDSGASGWACVGLTNPAGDYSFLGRGAKIQFNAETTTIEQVFTTLSSTTIAAIHYDSGVSGLCTIQLATPFDDLERNQMLHFATGGIYVRVLSITKGPDGLSSLRCNTGNVNIGNGDTVTSIPSVRVYFTATHATGESVSQTVVQSSFTLGSGLTQQLGWLTVASTPDLTQINGRPVTPEDYMHISLMVDNPQNVLFGRFCLDVDATTNDFTRNFYYQPFEQNDFTESAQGSSSQTTSQQQAISLQQIRAYNPASYYETGALGDFVSSEEAALLQQAENPYASYPISTSMQASTGSTVWTEFLFKMSDLQRVGSDDTRSLANVQKIRIEMTVNGPVNLSLSSWWAGGTYGPDILDNTYGVQGFPILARYRYRNSLTGAISVQSPALRSGVLPRRNSILLSGAQSSDPQVDYIDWEIFGGSNESWHYAGSVPNTSNNQFICDITNAAVLANDPLSTVAFQPFPVSDTPKHSVVNVAGTAVTWVSGDQFNTSWAAGTQILVNSKAYTLYAPPASATQLYVVENIGAFTSVPMVIAEPTIMGQALPVMWGPDQNGRYFGAGDLRNPGNVYPTNADADGGIDGASDQTVVTLLSSPSDPVMNGAIVEDTSIVLTSQTIQKLQPTPGENGLGYVPVMLDTGRGLFARYGMCVYGGALWYVGNDGVYRWNSGTGSVSITDANLGPLFPHGSLPGNAVTRGNVTVNPPDFTQPNNLRLSGANGYIFFDYPDTTGQWMTLAYKIASNSWWLWKYADPATLHYQEEGQNINTALMGTRGGTLAFLSSGSGDNGAGIPCAVYTKAYGAGDPRSPKVYGDAWLKANTAGATISVSVATNDYTTITALSSQLSSTTPTSFFLDLTDGNGNPSLGNLKTNLGLLLNWSSSSPDGGSQLLYFWEVGPWEVRPQIVQNWASQPTTHGMNGFQHVREVWIPYNSTAAFTLKVVADGIVYSYPFPSSGGTTVKTRLDTNPIKGKLFWYGTEGGPTTIFFEDIEVKVKEWGSNGPYQSVRPFA